MLGQPATDRAARLRRSTSPLAWALAACVAALASCGGPGDAAAEGEECFRAADCDEGLVCIAGVCSRDLADVVSQIEGPAAGQDASASGAAGEAGAGGEAGGSEAGQSGGSAGAASGGSNAAGGAASGGASGASSGGSSSGGTNGSGGSGMSGSSADASGD
jgi:hypothetical protein